MNPKHRLVFIGLLLVIAAGMWLLMQQSGPSTIPLEPEAAGVRSSEGPAAAGPAAPSTALTPELRERTEVEGAAEDPARPDLDPEHAAALTGFTGRVVDHRSEPVPGASFKLLRISADSVIPADLDLLAGGTVEPDIDAGETRTGDDGRFALHGVWPHGLYLASAGRDGENPTMRIVDRTPGPGEVVDLGDFALRFGAVLTGKVVDEDGKPIAGALIRAADLPAIVTQFVPIEQLDPDGAIIVREASPPVVVTPPAWAARRFEQLPIARTHSAADGTFRLAGIEPGESMVAVTAAGRQSLVRPGLRLVEGEDRSLGELRLQEGESVFGKVVDDQGKPIADAEVLLAQTNPVNVDFAPPAIRSGKDGTFELTGFKSGKVTAATRRSSAETWTVFDPKPISDDLVLALPSVHTLTVHVRDAAAKPVPAPRLQLLPSMGGDTEATIGFTMFGMALPVDLTGRMSRDEKTGAFLIRGLPKGSYLVRADAPGMALANAKVSFEADTTVELKLEANTVFDVEVVDEAGRPIRGASVYAMVRGGPRPAGELPTHCGRTDAAGLLRVDRLRAERVDVTAKHPKYGGGDGNGQLPLAAPIRITLATPGGIEGILTDGGRQPEPGKYMVILNREGAGRQAMPDMPRFTVPVVDGRFRAGGLRPGTYRLFALESLRAVTTFGSGFQMVMGMEAGGFEPNFATVEVVTGQTAQATLEVQRGPEVIDGPSAPLAGIVTLNGHPPQDALMQIWAGRRRTVPLDAAGRFDFGQVQAGTHNLSLRVRGGMFGPNQEIWEGQVEIKANEPRNIEIHVVTTRIEGTVLGPDGMPVPAAGVMVSGEPEPVPEGSAVRTGGIHRWVNSDAQGRFRVENVIPGTYSLRAERDGVGLGTREGIKVTGNTPQLGIDVQLARTMHLRGRLEFSDRIKFEHAQLSLSGHPEGKPDQDLHAWAQIQDDGSFDVQNAAPGVYEVHVWVKPQDKEEWKQYRSDQNVTVPNHDLDGVRIVVQPEEPRPRRR